MDNLVYIYLFVALFLMEFKEFKEDRKVYKGVILITIMRKYIKKDLVCIKCPECNQEICGTSELQAKAMLKEHRRSKTHKLIVTTLKDKVFLASSGAIHEHKKEWVQK